MASNLCCITDDRPASPALPSARRIYISRTEGNLLDGLRRNRNPSFTSTKTEELNDLRKIFADANLDKDGLSNCDGTSSTRSNRTISRIANFLRRKLSRERSRSKPALQTDPNEFRKLRQDLHRSLLADHRPESGGYDSDAPAIEDIHDIEQAEFGVGRRRTTKCSRRGLQEIHWATTAPNRYAASTGLITADTPDKGRSLRRSVSESSLLRGSTTTDFRTLRLPSFSATADSKLWKFSVMESLRIASPSIANLKAASLQASKGTLETLVDNTEMRHGGQNSTIESHASSKLEDYVPQSPIVGNEQVKIAPRAPAPAGDEISCVSTVKEGSPLSSAPLVHLYNMGISHHLRSQSTATSVAPTRPSTPVLNATKPDESRRNERKMSGSGFGSSDIPESWGRVIKDETSSIYSSAVQSPIESFKESKPELPKIDTDHHVQEPEVIDRAADSVALEEVIPTTDGSTSKTKPIQSPSEPSHPSLSGPGKTSRFKEEFKLAGFKQVPRPRSLIGLFQSKKTVRPCSENLGSMDGSLDEPQRLQRALALTERHDATGLMASAIITNRDEKAALLLPGHKDQADLVGVRERSHSFSRPRTHSAAGGSIDAAGPACSLPAPLERRARSAVQLKPEFSTPVFSESTLNPPSEQRSKSRALSVAIDPGMLPPISLEPRRSISTPAFQLNDVTVDLKSETSENTTVVTPASATYPALREESIEDSEADLSAWARYPSHTREIRTGSAGLSDNVKTRDFAYHPGINATVESSSGEEASSGKRKKGKKKKKQRPRTGMPKSRSMMFAKEFFKNYARHIRAPNVEFLKHGHGHRTSISTGGKLEYPELEILPPAFAATPIMDSPGRSDDEGLHNRDSANADRIELRVFTPGQSSLARRASLMPRRLSDVPPDVDGALVDAEVFNRQSRRSVSSPSLALSHGPESIYSQNNAQFWSRMYESCVELPRFSVSADHSVSHSRQVSAIQCHSSSEDHVDKMNPSVPLLVDEVLPDHTMATVIQKDEMPDPLCLHHPTLAEDKLQVVARMGAESQISILSLPARLGHDKKDSVCSVDNIRASSMDLWKLLKETEEKERLRLMGTKRVSVEMDDIV